MLTSVDPSPSELVLLSSTSRRSSLPGPSRRVRRCPSTTRRRTGPSPCSPRYVLPSCSPFPTSLAPKAPLVASASEFPSFPPLYCQPCASKREIDAFLPLSLSTGRQDRPGGDSRRTERRDFGEGVDGELLLELSRAHGALSRVDPECSEGSCRRRETLSATLPCFYPPPRTGTAASSLLVFCRSPLPLFNVLSAQRKHFNTLQQSHTAPVVLSLTPPHRSNSLISHLRWHPTSPSLASLEPTVSFPACSLVY